jgi:hypothetical protein
MKPTKANQKLLAKSFGNYGTTLKPTADGTLCILTDRKYPLTQSGPMTLDDASGVLVRIEEAIEEAFSDAIVGLTEAA